MVKMWVYEFLMTVVTNDHKLGDLKQHKRILTVLEANSLKTVSLR